MPESPKTKSMTIPPPVLGWNTKDPISQMDPLYSPGIENYFPDNGVVALRNGNLKHVKTAVASPFLHLAELVNNAGTRYLIAFNELGAGYDVTSPGAGSALGGGQTAQDDEVYTVNFRGRLFVKGNINTADVFYTDGTTTTTSGFTGPAGGDADLWKLATYKGRFYALQRSDASMWYGAVDAITGAMTQFDWQSLLSLGGKPWHIGDFSMSGGDSTQNYFIMISQQGEVLLYQGDSPSDTTWAQVGRYNIPAPVGRKSFFKWGSDVLVITYEGLVSIRDVVASGGSGFGFLTENIAPDFKNAILACTATEFISGFVYPKGRYLGVNFYDNATATASQFIMNTTSRAWTKFTNQNGASWALLDNTLYWAGVSTFGGVSYVSKSDTGYFDDNPVSPGSATSRSTKLQFAYNYLDSSETVKIPTEIRPIMYESEGLSITSDVNVDYEDRTATSTVTDTTDTSYKFYKPVCGTTAMPGKAISVRFDGSVTTKRRSIQAVEVFWKDGDIR